MNSPIERARRYVAAMAPAISGQGGHNQTFRAACALVNGFALDTESALDLLLTDFNPRCQPPWTERELRHKVSDAARLQHYKPRGYLLANRYHSNCSSSRKEWARNERATPLTKQPSGSQQTSPESAPCGRTPSGGSTDLQPEFDYEKKSK